MNNVLSLDEYLAAMITEAARVYPDAGFMLIAVDDTKDGELTTLTNMDKDEVEHVLELAQDGHINDEPQREFAAADVDFSLTRH